MDASSSDDDISGDDDMDMDATYSSSGDEGDGNPGNKKRPILVRLRPTRKKTRSMDETSTSSTGLSPRLNKMDIVAAGRKQQQDMGVFFLDDGVETFSVDGDPRLNGVREIYTELDNRLERAAFSAGLNRNDPAVSNLKKQLALRAAELEALVAEKFGTGGRPYRDSLYRVIAWIQAASDSDLRDVLDGRLNNFSLEDRQQPQSLSTSSPTSSQASYVPHQPQPHHQYQLVPVNHAYGDVQM